MELVEVLIRKVIDWLLEIPLDRLGRRVERFLDRAGELRRRKRKPWHRKTRKLRRRQSR
jgi:hypothetical protein